MAREKPLCCPVCRAGFRASRLCSRCGADLSVVMYLAAQAHRLRGVARQALRRGEFTQACQAAAQAQTLCQTDRGRRLALLSGWLATTEEPARYDHGTDVP